MLPKSGPPKSRLSRRQVIVYLPASIDRPARDLARRQRYTLQRFVGMAVNARLSELGIDPILTYTQQHLFVRVEKAAATRTAASPSRAGRTAMAGWFERDEVERLNRLTDELGTSVQDIAEAGVMALLKGEADGLQMAG